MRVVEVGQYFVTRNAGEFLHTVACREYTLPRDDPASQPKGWIRGNTRIGPILEVKSFNEFSAESKKAIKESGNIEISEIVNTEPKWQCKSCLKHCNP